MEPWKLWSRETTLYEIHSIEPLLASWERTSHPAQVRLKAYLSDLMSKVHPLPSGNEKLCLHLDVDVKKPERLLHHYDLENYLTPLFGSNWLDPSRFVYVSATKHVGTGSRLIIGTVRPYRQFIPGNQWQHFTCKAEGSVQRKEWKQQIFSSLAAQVTNALLAGPLSTILAWRCSPSRNWATLWKPTGDTMGPILGMEHPRNQFNPRDDRIVSLELHRISDASVGYSMIIGMWWKPFEGKDAYE